MSRPTCANPSHSSACCLPPEPLYYVQCTRGSTGNCALWWAENHHGYTADLARAHVFTETEVRQKRWRSIDVPRLKSEVDAQAIRHAHVSQLPDMPAWVRQEGAQP